MDPQVSVRDKAQPIVLGSIGNLGGIINDSKSSLDNTADAVNRFKDVKNNIFGSVESVKSELNTLKSSSDQVISNFQQMNEVFNEVQNLSEQIKVLIGNVDDSVTHVKSASPISNIMKI